MIDNGDYFSIYNRTVDIDVDSDGEVDFDDAELFPMK